MSTLSRPTSSKYFDPVTVPAAPWNPSLKFME
jgi:hypothetical protein